MYATRQSLRAWLSAGAAGMLLSACSNAPHDEPGADAGAGDAAVAEGTQDAALPDSPTSTACAPLAGAYILRWPASDTYSSTPGWMKTIDVALFLEPSCSAVLTPAFRPSVKHTPVLSAAELLFEGQRFLTLGNYPNRFSGEEYEFKTIRLPRGPQGLFSGVAEATIDTQVLAYDVASGLQETVSGSIAAATAAPQLRIGPADVYLIEQSALSGGNYPLAGGPRRSGYPAAMMPWEPLQVAASEPLAGLAGAAVGPVPFVDAAVTPELVAHDTWAWAFLDDWEKVRGTSVQVSVPAGLQTLGGIPGPASSSNVDVFDVGPALGSHEFDGAALSIGVYGDVVQDGGSLVLKEHKLSSTSFAAGRLLTSGKAKVSFEVALTPQMYYGALLIHASGHTGREYAPVRAMSTSSGMSGTVSIDIQNEDEIGFTLVPMSFSGNMIATVARVWAE